MGVMTHSVTTYIKCRRLSFLGGLHTFKVRTKNDDLAFAAAAPRMQTHIHMSSQRRLINAVWCLPRVFANIIKTLAFSLYIYVCTSTTLTTRTNCCVVRVSRRSSGDNNPKKKSRDISIVVKNTINARLKVDGRLFLVCVFSCVCVLRWKHGPTFCACHLS